MLTMGTGYRGRRRLKRSGHPSRYADRISNPQPAMQHPPEPGKDLAWLLDRGGGCRHTELATASFQCPFTALSPAHHVVAIHGPDDAVHISTILQCHCPQATGLHKPIVPLLQQLHMLLCRSHAKMHGVQHFVAQLALACTLAAPLCACAHHLHVCVFMEGVRDLAGSSAIGQVAAGAVQRKGPTC